MCCMKIECSFKIYFRIINWQMTRDEGNTAKVYNNFLYDKCLRSLSFKWNVATSVPPDGHQSNLSLWPLECHIKSSFFFVMYTMNKTFICISSGVNFILSTLTNIYVCSTKISFMREKERERQIFKNWKILFKHTVCKILFSKVKLLLTFAILLLYADQICNNELL